MSTPAVTPYLSPPVRGFLHVPSRTNGLALALTHGAGGNANGALLVKVASACAEAGFVVLRFDFPYRQERPTGPPRNSAAADRDNIRIAVEQLKTRPDVQEIIMGGHSYGGRMASMLAAEDRSLTKGLLLLSYPLHPPKTKTMRTAHFAEIQTPVLFIQGERDPFGGPEELREAAKTIPARTTISGIVRAGHDLQKGEFDLAGFLIEPLQQILSA